MDCFGFKVASKNKQKFNSEKQMKSLLLTSLILLFISSLVYAEQPSDTSEQPFEIVIGVTTYQDILDNFGSPQYTTKTEKGDQIWGYRDTKVESIEDDSVPEQDAAFSIEFDKNGIVSNYQIMTEDEFLLFKKRVMSNKRTVLFLA